MRSKKYSFITDIEKRVKNNPEDFVQDKLKWKRKDEEQ